MKTFPNVNYKTMRDTYDKCSRIVDFLESSLPIGKVVYDYVETEATPSIQRYGKGMRYTASKNKSTKRQIDFPMVSSFDRKEKTICFQRIGEYGGFSRESLGMDEAIKLLTRSDVVNVRSTFDNLSWMQGGMYSFHKSVYDQAKKALDAMQSESDVNTLNISLISALQFLSELDEVDLNEGVYQYDTDAIDGIINQAEELKVAELQKEYDQKFNDQLDSFKDEFNNIMSDGDSDFLVASEGDNTSKNVPSQKSILDNDSVRTIFLCLTICFVSTMIYLGLN